MMTFCFSRLRNSGGERIDKPQSVTGAILDIDKHRLAVVFAGEHSAGILGELHVMEFEAHADGIFLRGFESPTPSKAIYQEWWLRYETGGGK